MTLFDFPVLNEFGRKKMQYLEYIPVQWRYNVHTKVVNRYRVHSEKHMVPSRWKSSKGTFTTKHNAEKDMTLPEYSSKK